MFELDDHYRAVQREAQALAAEIAPFAAEADTKSEIYQPVLDALRSSNLSQYMVPRAYGGRDEMPDPLAITLIREAFMYESAHLDSIFALQGIGSYAITVAGTDEQKAEWLPKVASAEALAAIALTEPIAGSDLKSITTRAEIDGDEAVINGEKAFISNGKAATFFTTFVREDDGYSLFLVPADTPGVTITDVPPLMAPHVLGNVTYDNVRVPVSARIGEPGKGLGKVLATLTVFRVSVAGAACGLAQGALEEATRHAKTREQFGRPLARLGAVAALLADSWTDLEAARLLTYRAAERARDGYPGTLEHSSMAKVFATEAACRVVDRCVQVMGRWGVIAESKIERCYREARPMRIYEGASEVLRLGIARQLTLEVE